MKPFLFGLFAIAFLCATAPAWGAPKKPAPPAKNALPPIGTYADYAFSKNVSSYDRNDPKYAEIGAMPASIKTRGVGYVVLAGGSSQTLFHAPLGWYPTRTAKIRVCFRPICARGSSWDFAIWARK